MKSYYKIKLRGDLKLLTRFLNDINESFIEQYAKKFDIENKIFICDPGRKSGHIPFKFDLTKEYIKQFLLSSSPPDFNNYCFKKH